VIFQCPFCAGDRVEAVFNDYDHRYFVYCDDCQAGGPARDDKQDAIDAWNFASSATWPKRQNQAKLDMTVGQLLDAFKRRSYWKNGKG